MSETYKKLIKTLQTIFEMDKADLDFGIYRIMNQKRDEIDYFLENDLLPQVNDAFADYVTGSQSEFKKELQSAIEQAKEFGAPDPENAPAVLKVKEKMASSVDVTAVENEVYSHLHTFFSRYYDKGDFISQRRYKSDTYAIPYEGEEVKLYWANYDQYYIKSSEHLRDYTFTVETDSEKSVRIKLVEADIEKDNVKAESGEERKFVLDKENPVSIEGDELYIHFHYIPAGKKKQTTLNDDAVEAILKQEGFDEWLDLLKKNAGTEKNPNRTLLEKHLHDYTARNTFDYFIHKNLGGFLRRELDFYIKNEVMHLDDIDDAAFEVTDQHLRKIKIIRNIAHKLIRMLDQLEEFQRKLWLKKKFVVQTNYCITLDRVPLNLYEDICSNEGQHAEWVQLCFVSENEIITEEFLKDNSNLILDTHYFDENFTAKLLASIHNFDEQCDGLLINSDNFQALNLLEEKYRHGVVTIYIDPPYNTAASEINYKNNYKHSSWLSLMRDRLAAGKKLLNPEKGFLCCTIDDVEQKILSQLIEGVYGEVAGTVSIRIKPSGRPIPNGFALSHEYAIFARSNPSNSIKRLSHSEEQIARYRERDDEGRYFWEMFRKAGSNSNRENRPTMFYAFYVNKTNNAVRLANMEYQEEEQEYNIFEDPNNDEVKVFPIKDDGSEGCWYFGYERAKRIADEFKAVQQDDNSFRIYYRRRLNEGVQPTTHWSDSKYSATEHGTALLKSLFGKQEVFSYPKSIHAVKDCLDVCGALGNTEGVFLDYFAGSGTTAHAIINMNREDGGKRRYILTEMGDYFDTVLKPRIKKCIYSSKWKDGKPVFDGSDGKNLTSHCFKYIHLESYEDSLNNLDLIENTKQQQNLLAEHVELREDYMLGYWLNVETADSASLLNTEKFENPFSYKLNIATRSVGANKPTTIDIVETFNYLLGLTIKNVDTVRGLKLVTATNPKEESVLVIWRKIKEKDNAALEEFLEKLGYNPKDTEFDHIYINGDHTLEDPHSKVKMIEVEFKRLMFDVKDV